MLRSMCTQELRWHHCRSTIAHHMGLVWIMGGYHVDVIHHSYVHIQRSGMTQAQANILFTNQLGLICIVDCCQVKAS